MILEGLRHPTERLLLTLAAGHAGDSRQVRASTHIASCARCAKVVDELRTVEQLARELRHPAFDERRTWQQIRWRLSATAGVDRRVAIGWQWLAPAVVTSAALLIVAAYLTGPSPILYASGSTGVLQFSPAAPTRGAEIGVRYTPPPALRQHETLVLRGRLRSAHDVEFNAAIPTRPVAVLTSDASGDFRGRFTLPDSIVFAALSLETADGSAVDHNGRALWELMIHEASGAPSNESLEQRMMDVMGRDWESAAETARQRTLLYPADPTAWQWRWSFESRLSSGAARDSLRSEYAGLFKALEARYAADSLLPGRIVYGMHALAISAGGRERAGFWRKRLAAASADSARWRDDPWLVRARSIEVNATGGMSEPAHETLWRVSGTRDPLALSQARTAAYVARDGSALLKWTARLLQVSPDIALPLLRDLHELRGYEREAIALIGHAVQTYDDPAARPLDAATSDMRLVRRRAIRLADAAIGRLRLAQGDTALAVTAFLEAAESGWDPLLFRELAARLHESRHPDAVLMASLAAADPGAPAGYADSVRVRLSIAQDDWNAQVAAAKIDMMRRVAEDEPTARYSIDGAIRVRSRDGQDLILSDLVRGKVTLLAYWSRNCGPSLSAMPALEATARRLQELGVQVVTLSKQASVSEAEVFLRDNGYTFPLYFESSQSGRLTHSDLHMTGTPAFAFVDRRGRMRYAGTDLTAALAQAMALLEER